jgi:hypothetical protein
MLDDGGYRLSWPNASGQGQVHIYRVVTDDWEPLYSPDAGQLLETVIAESIEDHRPFVSPVRRVQVWCNSGSTVESAKAAQPRLHAEGAVVAPVSDFHLREDSGHVTGQWTVFPGVKRVQVFRVPVELAASGHMRPKYRVFADLDNLVGFEDGTAEKGRRYLYEAAAEVELDDATVLSIPAQGTVRVSVVLQQIQDLAVEQHGPDDDPQFDVSWTAPAGGDVVIFRTSKAPYSGIEDRERRREDLVLAGLAPDDQLRHPVAALEGGRVGMRNVPWPRGWSMAYFTPATVLDDRAYVGLTRASVRVGAAGEPEIQERVVEQRLVFRWPEGADSVLVYTSAPDVPVEAALESEPVEISRHQYEEPRALRLQRRLPWDRPSTLYLVACSFEGGKRHYGRPVAVNYPGLLRIRYRVDQKGRKVLRNRSARIILEAETDTVPPPFALICNAGRLPLSIDDGVPLQVVRACQEGARPAMRLLAERLGPQVQDPGWIADVEGAHLSPGVPYFVRLFADLQPEMLARVAVIDPSAGDLRLQ